MIKQIAKLMNKQLTLGSLSALALAILLLLSAAYRLNAADVSPFKTLLGTWGGGGMVTFQDNSRERLNCNAYYTGGGSQLRLAIRCSSNKQKIHMRGNLSYNAGRVSGHWEERTFNAEGRVSGRATEKRLSVSIGGNVTGTMTVSYSKTRQSVSISTKGTAMRTVNINLSRR